MSVGVNLAAEAHGPLDDRPRCAGMNMGLWVVGGLPLLLLALSSDWCITPPGFIDPWVYFGYYQNLPQHLRIFDGTYYGTRLSAILPGYAAYHCLPPLAANYVLHLGLYYACVLSLYLILARTVSRRAGLLAAACLGCQFFFLRAIGWDYVNGFGLTYFCLSVLALTTAAQTRFWKSSLVAAGIGSAAFVIANTFYVILVLYFVLHYLYLNRQSRRNPLLRSIGLYLLGVAGLTLALCLFSRLVAGRFWFLGPTLHFAQTFVGQANPWKVPLSTWLPLADWLIVPALTALGSLFFCYWFRSGLHAYKTGVFYQVQFVLPLGVMIGWEWWGQPVLQVSDYASLLLPAALIAFGAQLGPHVERLSTRQFGLLLAMVLIVLLAPYIMNNAGEWPARLSPWLGVLTVAGGTFGIAVLASRRPGAISATVLIALFISISSYAGWHAYDDFKRSPRHLCSQDDNPLRRDHYKATDVLRAVFDADQVIQKWDPAGRALFWYNARAPMGHLCTAVASTYLWGYRLINVEFPAVSDHAAYGRLKDQRVVILSADPNALGKANIAMEEMGLEAQPLAQQNITYPSAAFTMYYIAIKAKGSWNSL